MPPLPSNAEIFITQDGSPTLQWRRSDDGYGEKMHHSGGALSESLYIYHSALVEVLDRGWPARVISLGLGLAYNELIVLGEVCKRDLKDWHLWSFESEDFLRHGFAEWLSGKAIQEPMNTLFAQVLAGVAEKLALQPDRLKEFSAQALHASRCELRGRFPECATDVAQVSCWFYDAYSRKMTPELWNENTLNQELKKMAAERCVLATYASMGAMKRALRALGFRLTAKPGFLGKRESTLAIRE